MKKKSKELSLRQIIKLEQIKLPIWVDYRTYCDGTDIFCGGCYVNADYTVTPIDGDSYSLDDKFYKYELSDSGKETYLSCYYKSKWRK